MEDNRVEQLESIIEKVREILYNHSNANELMIEVMLRKGQPHDSYVRHDVEEAVR